MPSDIPTAIWSGTFKLMGVELKCHTLSDGQRVIEAESMNAFFEAMENGEMRPDFDEPDWTAFYRWQRGD
jgi:hypothetical protein